jgi:hypothetical protein
MAVTYQNSDEKNIVRQPLFKRIRSFYRTARKSSQENLFYQKIYMDLSRIYIELELINTKIFNRVKLIIGAETSSTHEIDTEVGSKYYGAKYYDLTKDSVAFFNAGASATPSISDDNVNLYTTNSIAAKLINLNFKINQLERRER